MSLNSVYIDWKKNVKLTKNIQLDIVMVGSHKSAFVKKLLLQAKKIATSMAKKLATLKVHINIIRFFIGLL